MSTRLCEFVKSGSPNADGLVEWKNDGTPLTFGDKPTAEKKPSIFKLWVTMFTNKAPGE